MIYDFFDNVATWYPTEPGTYYIKILCDDERSSYCTAVSVANAIVNPNVFVSCPFCQASKCDCYISGCQEGVLNIYAKSDCIATPSLAYDFYNGKISWSAPKGGDYFIKVLCDDKAKSGCIPLHVAENLESCIGRCNEYTKGAACQCDIGCIKNNDCCKDFCEACSKLCA
ncbi:MAG: hypothetical protein QXQ40_01040 [Candidatus Aenigmatarchaeota archaeon]